ncbi:MAG: phosphosulfolactate synthase [Candidatus Gracilibacteria bacterium]
MEKLGQNYIITGYKPDVTQDFLDRLGPHHREGIGGIKLTTHCAENAQSEWAKHQGICSVRNVPFYVGGGLMDQAIKDGTPYDLVKKLHAAEIDTIEISNPEDVDPQEFLKIAKRIRQDFNRVLVEIGKKDYQEYPLHWWMRRLLNAEETGADAIVLEGAGSGRVGIYHIDGSPRHRLVESIAEITETPIIIEAPYKSQQDLWIEKFGPNIPLGNILLNTQAVQDVSVSREREAIRRKTTAMNC